MAIKSVLIQKIVETNPIYAEMFEGKGKIYTFLNSVLYLDAQEQGPVFTFLTGYL